jgi:thioredoxin-related protein
MLKFKLILLPVISISSIVQAGAIVQVNDDKNEPAVINWLTPDQALEQQAETGKKILFYVFTPTCGFCQRTAAEVLVDDTVIETINELFLPVRINAGSRELLQMKGETYTNREIAVRLGTEYVPFYVIMENDEILGSRSGFHNAEKLTALLVFYADEHYRQMTFEDFERNW